jgi:hypothetical protein
LWKNVRSLRTMGDTRDWTRGDTWGLTRGEEGSCPYKSSAACTAPMASAGAASPIGDHVIKALGRDGLNTVSLGETFDRDSRLSVCLPSIGALLESQAWDWTGLAVSARTGQN